MPYKKYGKTYFKIGKKHFMYRTGKDKIPRKKPKKKDDEKKKRKPRKDKGKKRRPYKPRFPVPDIPDDFGKKSKQKPITHWYNSKEAIALALTLATIGKIL